MRYLKTSRKSDDDLSAPSSVQSVDSYEIFGSAGSESSDGELYDGKKRRLNNTNSGSFYSLPGSTVTSYRSTMDRMQASPLLGDVAPPPYYNTILVAPDSVGYKELSPFDILDNNKKQLETPVESNKKKQSSLVTIFSVWNTILGSSLLTMAWGVERAGLPAALILVAVMAALCLYTAYLLLKVNKYHGGGTVCEVPALCRLLLGAWAQRAAHLFSLVVLCGANIIYWILISNFLYFTVNYFMDISTPRNSTAYSNAAVICPHQAVNGSLIIPAAGADSPYWGLHTTVPVYVCLIIFPLLNFKNVSFFTKLNSLGTLSVVYLLVFVVVKGWMWGVNLTVAALDAPAHPHAAKDAAVLSGMLALSFYIHNIIITVMSNNERQENNGRDLTIAFVLVTITYTLVGVVFYICFPLAKSCIQDNILNNFEMNDVMSAMARILLLFQGVTVYPLVAFMLRTEAILLLPVPAAWKQQRWLAVATNVAIVTLCILMACFCPSIGTIIRYTGAVSGLVHIFALPSLLYVRSLQLRGKLTKWKATFFILITLLGTINLFVQFFISE